MVQSYDVGTIFGQPFVQCIVRTMFVQCSYNVRTMAKKVRSMFVQFTTKIHTILYELLAIVRTLYNESLKFLNLLKSLIYVNPKIRSNFVATS